MKHPTERDSHLAQDFFALRGKDHPARRIYFLLRYLCIIFTAMAAVASAQQAALSTAPNPAQQSSSNPHILGEHFPLSSPTDSLSKPVPPPSRSSLGINSSHCEQNIIRQAWNSGSSSADSTAITSPWDYDPNLHESQARLMMFIQFLKRQKMDEEIQPQKEDLPQRTALNQLDPSIRIALNQPSPQSRISLNQPFPSPSLSPLPSPNTLDASDTNSYRSHRVPIPPSLYIP